MALSPVTMIIDIPGLNFQCPITISLNLIQFNICNPHSRHLPKLLSYLGQHSITVLFTSIIEDSHMTIDESLVGTSLICFDQMY